MGSLRGTLEQAFQNSRTKLPIPIPVYVYYANYWPRYPLLSLLEEIWMNSMFVNIPFNVKS